MSCKIVLCDIEGTTTSISFVKDNLFPYAASNVESYLSAHWDEADTKEAVKMLRDQYAADKNENMDGCVEIVADSEDKAKQIESIVANVKWQMEHDRKAGPLKNLQGMMWVAAYKAGAFKGQVYEDVAPAFEAWTKAGRKIYIYSSGSAAIQKVHFEHSDSGDLAKYLSGYYDTKVGAKQEKSSYEAIFKAISKDIDSLNSADILFLTDIPAEAKAAKEAGMETILLKRPGNAELTEDDCKTYRVVSSFAEIVAEETKKEGAAEEETQTKRKIEDDAQDVVPPAKVAKIDTDAAVPTTPPPTAEEKSKTEDETKDVPMTAEVDAVAIPAPESFADKTEEKEKKQTSDEPEKVETMEVDSTTTSTVADIVPVVAIANATTTTTTTPTEEIKPSGEEAKIVPKEESAEAEIKTVETPKDAEMKDVTEEKAAAGTVAEKPEVTVTDSSAVEEKKDEPAKENGTKAAEVAASSEEIATKEPAKNGESGAKAVEENGSSAEAKAQNGTNGQHDDSDKENDKSMEATPDEVSTTSAAAGDSEATADVIAAKKCAVIDAPSPAGEATPVPAVVVEAES